MKHILDVRSNPYFTQNEDQNEFKLEPSLELVIIHSDGKNYEIEKNKLKSTTKLSEIRLIVNPEMLQALITDLQLHQKMFETIKANAEQLNSLVRHLSNKE